MRRKHGIRAKCNEHECQWRWPSCLLNVLSLICCGMQLYVCVQNLFDADMQRRAGTRDGWFGSALCLRFQRRERRDSKDTGQTAASTECGARELNFEMRAACSRGGCLTCVFSASICTIEPYTYLFLKVIHLVMQN